MKFLGSGGVGGVLTDYHRDAFTFCLKIVKRSCRRDRNRMFWDAAKAIQAWTANIRFHAQFTKLPAAQQYWLRSDRPCAERLSSLITADGGRRKLGDYENCPAELAEVVPDEYILCPEEELAEIFREDRAGKPRLLDLLITYPVQKGGRSAAQAIRDGETISEQDLLDCCCQLLSAIRFLYEKHAAHRDIKPANILVDGASGSRVFRLIDFDAFHSPEHLSDAGTSLFLPQEQVFKELRGRYPELEFRVLLDCFALAQTISCMAAKSELPPVLPPREVPAAVRRLYRIGTFRPEQIKDVLAELTAKCRLPDFTYAPENGSQGYRFDSKKTGSLGEYGTFHEQLWFTRGRSRNFDPLLKTGVRDVLLCREFPDMMLCPLGGDHSGSYFHAPDDAATGEPPRDFEFTDYRPRTLRNTVPAEEEKKLLADWGGRLNNYFRKHPKEQAFLPQEEHILWCDGRMRLLWGAGPRLKSPVDYGTYFRNLAGEAADFSYPDWRLLLKLRTEWLTKRETPPEYWRNILDELLHGLWDDRPWLFEVAQFRNFILAEAEHLPVAAWLRLLPVVPGLADRLDAETLWRVYRSAAPRKKEELLASPQFGAELRDRVAAAPREHFLLFFRAGRHDPETFLRSFPETVRAEFSGRTWGKMLAVNPELLRFVPARKVVLLNRRAWVRVLGAYPEWLERCPKRDELTSADWASILVRQPGLKKFLPETAVFSDREMKRLQKKGLFAPDAK